MAIQSPPMASITRSTRRAPNTEGLQQLHALHHPVQQVLTNPVTTRAPQNIAAGYNHHHQHHQPLSSRTKRQLDSTDFIDFDHPKSKRSRSSIEILIRPALPTVKPFVANATAAAHITPTPQSTTTATKTTQATSLAKATPKPAQHQQQPPPSPKQQQQQQQQQQLQPKQKQQQQPIATVYSSNPSATPGADNGNQSTKHQEKVKTGIKHELNRLQPRETDAHTKDGGRKLRSQEATRFKSDLSAYFPEYDEVIGNDPKEQHLLNINTPIVIFDTNPTHPQSLAWHQYSVARAELVAPQGVLVSSSSGLKVPVRGYGDALFDDLVDAQRIDFDFLGISHKRDLAEDPLPDTTFVSSHKRAERLEKSIRNTERGRAQHEKDQIARLLDGLQGHDWLRVMGVSGITESRKKQFEPARNHFIKGCQAILDRFRQWGLEEKRRKAERDRALAEKAESEGMSEDDSSPGSRHGEEDEKEGEDDGNISDGDPPFSSDDDESGAKQLRGEAVTRPRASRNSKKRPRTAIPPRPPLQPEPPKEFKSFFKKRYERDAALHRHRRAGRKVVAWGLPIPEIPEVDFDLPEEFRDEETLKMQARKRRRDRRGRH